MNGKSKLRLLWFVNSLFPEAARETGLPPSGGGWWRWLAQQLSQRDGIELGIATVSGIAQESQQFRIGGVQYFVLAQKGLSRNLARIGFATSDAMLKPCLSVVDQFKPDVVVAHGTEYGYGLITPHVSVPVLVELQGSAKWLSSALLGRSSWSNRTSALSSRT